MVHKSDNISRHEFEEVLSEMENSTIESFWKILNGYLEYFEAEISKNFVYGGKSDELLWTAGCEIW